MKERIWQTSFGIAILVHLIVLGTLGYALRGNNKEQIQYIEVTMDELFAGPSSSPSPAASQQTSANQDNRTAVQTVAQRPKQSTLFSTAENVATEAQEMAENVSDIPAFAGNGPSVSTGSAGTDNGAISGEGSGNGAGGSGTGGAGNGTGRGSKQSPHVISGSRPAYPAVARENGWEGTVRVQVLISEAGKAQEVNVAASSGYDCLDEAVIRDMRRWRFSPARDFDGRPVAAWVTLPVKFDLANAD